MELYKRMLAFMNAGVNVQALTEPVFTCSKCHIGTLKQCVKSFET